MRDDFGYMAELPGTPLEQAWVREYLETLSEWERIVLAASAARRPPASAKDAVNHLLSLHSGSVYLAAGDYEGLGERRLHITEKSLPDDVLEYIELGAIGMRFEEEHPGYFVGSHYAAYPPENAMTAYQGRDSPLPEDTDWSVKLKLASPAAPEGVWLRLPDYQSIDQEDGSDGEIAAAKDALRVQSLNECALLEARCILPEAGDIAQQYESIEDLVFDGNNLGFILGERGQGAEHWMDQFAAALEYEGCRSLRFALDISQNLACYDWVSCERLKEFAADHLRSCGVSEELVCSGYIQMQSYAEDLLETSGFMLTRDESAYIVRNTRTFSYDYSTDAEAAPKSAPVQRESALPEDILNASPQLADFAAGLSPEETISVNAALRESLAGRGPDGLRQLQAAMDYEDCSNMKEAMEIAAHLDCYKFMEISVCDEAARQELLNKGLKEWVIERCFNLSSYTAISHGLDDLYTSDDTGLYVHKSDLSFQLAYWQKRTGPAGPSM